MMCDSVLPSQAYLRKRCCVVTGSITIFWQETNKDTPTPAHPPSSNVTFAPKPAATLRTAHRPRPHGDRQHPSSAPRAATATTAASLSLGKRHHLLPFRLPTTSDAGPPLPHYHHYHPHDHHRCFLNRHFYNTGRIAASLRRRQCQGSCSSPPCAR